MGRGARGLLLLALVAPAGCFDDSCTGFRDPSTNRCYEPAGGEDAGPREVPPKPGRILAVDLVTRDVIPIRDDVIGSGPTLDQPVAIELSSDRAIAYVADRSRILAIRIEDGSTHLVSGAGRGNGVPLDLPVGLEWDGGSGRLLVHDGGHAVAIAVDVASGDRTESLLPFAPQSTEEERRIIDALEGVEYIVFRGG